MSCAVRMTERCEQNGSIAIRALSPPAHSSSITPPSSGRRGSPSTVMPSAANSGRTASKRCGLSWLPAITTTLRAGVAQGEQRPQHERFGLGGRRRGLVQVAGDEHEVDPLGVGDARRSRPSTARCSSRRDWPRIVLPTCQSEVWRSFTPYVPCARARARRTGRRAARPRSRDRGPAAGRRAPTAGSPTPGTGTRRRAAPGSRAASTNIVPGLAIVARCRCAAGRKPYSGALRLGRVEPARDADRRVRDDAALDLARGLLRADEDDAERAAALGDVEQDLLDRRVALARARTC